MRVSTFDGKHFELLAETEFDRLLVDALDLVHHVSVQAPIRSPELESGRRTWKNSGILILVSEDDPKKLVADASRQVFGSLTKLLRLALRDTAGDSHVSALAADPKLQETLAAVHKQLELVNEALGLVVGKQKLRVEEVGGHDASSSGGSVGAEHS